MILFFPLRLFSRETFMSNQKQQKPTLTGQRFKTRKRGEKHLGIIINAAIFSSLVWFVQVYKVV